MKKYLLIILASLAILSCKKDDPNIPFIDNPQPEQKAGDFTGVISTRTITSHEICDEIGRLLLDEDPSFSALGALFNNLFCPEVTLTRISYLTPGPDGKLVEASGAICYPSDLQEYDGLLSIQHSTCDIQDNPSEQFLPVELAPAAAAGFKKVAVMADYLGYGLSQTADLQHPYLHNRLTGSTCADMISAAEQYLGMDSEESELPAKGSDSITLMGYSQGGAATMSTLFALQDRNLESRVDRVSAGAGPMDLNQFIAPLMSSTATYDSTNYIAFLIRGTIYGENMNIDPHNVFAPEVFTSGAYDAFSTRRLSEWTELLGTDMSKVINPNSSADLTALVDFLTGENSLVNAGRPANPEKVTLFHSASDPTVPYSCSSVAAEKWGCQLVTLELNAGHSIGAAEFILREMGLWDTYGNLLKLIFK